eukprot:TRINITY_DN1971_c0_g1_i3.p1 TRINITY_DN1971_c0_g1~~TRINITY_DN1971_c0_g1_i3.p1  ORF type:complete len:236 (-),score=70.38 TRINITY_DN1971_c0_g1_i3:139-846(-)
MSNPETKSSLMEVWEALNIELDDEITQEQFIHIMNEMGMRDPSILNACWSALDVNNSGTVQAKHVYITLVALLQGSFDDRIDVAFFCIDTTGDQLITREELRHFILATVAIGGAILGTLYKIAIVAVSGLLVDQYLNSVFEVNDLDGDGYLNQEEFRLWVHNGLPGYIHEMYTNIQQEESKTHAAKNATSGVIDQIKAVVSGNANLTAAQERVSGLYRRAMEAASGSGEDGFVFF